MRQIYLDNAATTPLRKEVLEAMLPYFRERYGNPNSLHALGRQAYEAIEESRARLACLVGANPSEVVFTSGGTESNNLALKGIALLNRKMGTHIITTRIEHSSVINPLKWLEIQGFEVTYLPVDEYGAVSPEQVRQAIRKDTILVTVGHANNEIGTVQDIAGIAKAAKEKNVPFHTDACQSFTKEEIDLKKMDLDMVSINAHKINGPKGVGALIVKRGIRLTPTQHGGQQESKMRGGTENVAGIVGFAKAADIATPQDVQRMRVLRDRLISGVIGGIGSVRLNGHPTRRLANNANFTFKAIEGESLLLRLDAKGIYCSTGSACSSQSLEPSHVITAIGLPAEESHGSLRMTVGHETKEEDIDYAVEVLKQEVEGLRRISPLKR
ncbi:MAG: cysteine desulfurase family protein [Candidatus Altiarchaeota archaeon]